MRPESSTATFIVLIILTDFLCLRVPDIKLKKYTQHKVINPQGINLTTFFGFQKLFDSP